MHFMVWNKHQEHSIYERLNKFLLENSLKMSKIDTNLFTKIKENDILLVQIYVDDIIFDVLMFHFVKNLPSVCIMSLMGELNFFLGLQIQAIKGRNFHQSSKVH